MTSSIVEEIQRPDLDQLYELLVESTNGKTKITKETLESDLFEPLHPIKALPDRMHPSINFELDKAVTDLPVCRALIAKNNDGKILGYLLFGYFFSPWVGRYIDLVDLYTRPDHRRKGVARRIFKYLVELSEREGYDNFMMNVSDVPQELRGVLKKINVTIVRDEDSDWSVYRIDFKNIKQV